ncbi:hypothetical protein O3G_MSEX009765 [Manduca sexta]|uniref:Uncharacterized protein n=1 Tax=Manduca sexta TaxID=7130 RepID=A0A922CR86_MANSE|nr:hypothetical protein O3G_MSEX009765 [Manduca sexta]
MSHDYIVYRNAYKRFSYCIHLSFIQDVCLKMSRLTLFVCVVVLVGAVVSVDLPPAPKQGEHGQHDQPDLKHPSDMHKHHDPGMQHDPSMQHEPHKMPDTKDIKHFQDMQGQGKS